MSKIRYRHLKEDVVTVIPTFSLTPKYYFILQTKCGKSFIKFYDNFRAYKCNSIFRK